MAEYQATYSFTMDTISLLGLEYKIFEFDYDIKWISLNVNYASNSPAGNLCFSGRLQAFRNRSREMRNKT